MKAYVAIAISFAARTCECDELTWESVTSATDADGSEFFKVRHGRKKLKGNRLTMEHFVTGKTM